MTAAVSARASLRLGVAGAREAARRGDLVIVVDALRMSSTVVTALASGMRAVVPALAPEECRGSEWITAGERGGVKIPGLDHGNSPVEIRAAGYRGRTLCLTTSNGTPTIAAAREGARAVLIGCLLNAAAVAAAAAELAAGSDVTLLAAGPEEAVEDLLAATEIGRRLPGYRLAGPLRPVASRDFAADFLASPHGRRLLRLGYRADVELCARVDLYDVVPIWRDGELVRYG